MAAHADGAGAVADERADRHDRPRRRAVRADERRRLRAGGDLHVNKIWIIFNFRKPLMLSSRLY